MTAAPAKRHAKFADLIAPPGAKLTLHILDADEQVLAEFKLTKADFNDERPIIAFRHNRTSPALLTGSAEEAILFNQKGGIRVTSLSVGVGAAVNVRLSAFYLAAGVPVTMERLLIDLTKVKAFLDGTLRWVVKG